MSDEPTRTSGRKRRPASASHEDEDDKAGAETAGVESSGSAAGEPGTAPGGASTIEGPAAVPHGEQAETRDLRGGSAPTEGGPPPNDGRTVALGGARAAEPAPVGGAEADDGGFTAFVEHVQLITGSVTVVSERSRTGPTSPPSPMAEERASRRPVPGPSDAPAPRARTSRARSRVRPEVLGLVSVLVLGLLCAGAISAVMVKTRDDAAAAAAEASAYAPPSSSVAASSDGPVVAVISDESALRSVSGVGVEGRWPQRLSEIAGVRVLVLASAGAGYVATGSGGDDFADLAADVPAAAAAVVFVGGAADTDAASLALAQGATRAVAVASRRAPEATVLVVGPLFAPTGVTDSEAGLVRNTLRSAAGLASVRFVDPIQAGWLGPVGSAAALTAADERVISTRLRTALGSSIE